MGHDDSSVDTLQRIRVISRARQTLRSAKQLFSSLPTTPQKNLLPAPQPPSLFNQYPLPSKRQDRKIAQFFAQVDKQVKCNTSDSLAPLSFVFDPVSQHLREQDLTPRHPSEDSGTSEVPE